MVCFKLLHKIRVMELLALRLVRLESLPWKEIEIIDSPIIAKKEGIETKKFICYVVYRRSLSVNKVYDIFILSA